MTGNNKLAIAARQMSGGGCSDLDISSGYAVCGTATRTAQTEEMYVRLIASQSASISSIAPISLRISSRFSSLSLFHSLFSPT